MRTIDSGESEFELATTTRMVRSAPLPRSMGTHNPLVFVASLVLALPIALLTIAAVLLVPAKYR